MEKYCAICLDTSNNNNYNEKIINSKDFVLRSRCDATRFNCECNIMVHRSCITSWVIQKNKCPICLMQVNVSRGYISDSCLTSSLTIIGYLFITYGVFILLYLDNADLTDIF